MDPQPTPQSDLLSLRISEGGGFITIPVPGNLPTGGFHKDSTGNEIVGWALQLAFALAILLVFIYLVWGGVQWLMSAGDKEKLAAARKRIMYAILGLVIIFFAIFFVNFILNFLIGNPCEGLVGAAFQSCINGASIKPFWIIF